MPFERPHASIAVEPNDQHIALFASFLQILHMTGMEHIEAPICEDDALAQAASTFKFSK
jgi:hypothetical protein